MAVAKGQKLKRPNLPPQRAGGRPSVYDSALDEQARRLCLLGLTDTEICEYFGINSKCMWRWDKEHPSFYNARKDGRIKADAHVAASLHDRAIGIRYTEKQAVKVRSGQYTDEVVLADVEKYVPPDTHAAALWLSNRQRGRWSIKPMNSEESEAEPKVKIVGGLPDE